MSRADLIHAALAERPGELVTRAELFAAAGGFYLTNNASSEARVKYGVEIEHELLDGEHAYRLVGALDEPQAAPHCGADGDLRSVERVTTDPSPPHGEDALEPMQLTLEVAA